MIEIQSNEIKQIKLNNQKIDLYLYLLSNQRIYFYSMYIFNSTNFMFTLFLVYLFFLCFTLFFPQYNKCHMKKRPKKEITRAHKKNSCSFQNSFLCANLKKNTINEKKKRHVSV